MKITALILLLLMPMSVYGSVTRIAILPFKNQSDENQAWLSEAFHDVLSVKFLGHRGLVVIERSRIDAMMDEKISGDENRRQWLGADYLLLGSFVVVQDLIQIQARIVHATTSKIQGDTVFKLKGKTSEIFDLQHQVAKEMAKRCGLKVGLLALQKGVATNVSAQRLYYRAVKAYRAKSYHQAVDLSREAQARNLKFFPEAHHLETSARLKLVELEKNEAKRQRQETSLIEKCRKDAAQAAPAFFDLGMALKSMQQYEEAIKAYRQYLRWIDENQKTIRWKQNLGSLRPLQFSIYPKRSYACENHVQKYGYTNERHLIVRNEKHLVCMDPIKGEVIWRAPVLPVGHALPNYRFSSAKETAFAEGPDHYFITDDKHVLALKKESGALAYRIDRVHPRLKGQTHREFLHMDEKNERAILFLQRNSNHKWHGRSAPIRSHFTVEMLDLKAKTSKTVGEKLKERDPKQLQELLDSGKLIDGSLIHWHGRIGDEVWYETHDYRYDHEVQRVTVIDLKNGKIENSHSLNDKPYFYLGRSWTKNSHHIHYQSKRYLGEYFIHKPRNKKMTLTRLKDGRNLWQFDENFIDNPHIMKKSLLYSGNGGQWIKSISVEKGELEWKYHAPQRAKLIAYTENGPLFAGKKGVFCVNISKETLRRDFEVLAHFNIAKCLKALKRYSQTLDAFDDALAVDVSFKDIYYERASVYKTMNQKLNMLLDYNTYLYWSPLKNKKTIQARRVLSDLGGVVHKARMPWLERRDTRSFMANEKGIFYPRLTQFHDWEGRVKWRLPKLRSYSHEMDEKHVYVSDDRNLHSIDIATGEITSHLKLKHPILKWVFGRSSWDRIASRGGYRHLALLNGSYFEMHEDGQDVTLVQTRADTQEQVEKFLIPGGKRIGKSKATWNCQITDAGLWLLRIDLKSSNIHVWKIDFGKSMVSGPLDLHESKYPIGVASGDSYLAYYSKSHHRVVHVDQNLKVTKSRSCEKFRNGKFLVKENVPPILMLIGKVCSCHRLTTCHEGKMSMRTLVAIWDPVKKILSKPVADGYNVTYFESGKIIFGGGDRRLNVSSMKIERASGELALRGYQFLPLRDNLVINSGGSLMMFKGRVIPDIWYRGISKPTSK